MLKVNLVLWIVSLALQCVLLMALVSRGIARRLPALGVLIGFYILRSLVLYGLANHLPQATYALTLSGLALMDVLLQVVVAWELLSARSAGSVATGRTVAMRMAVFSGLLLIAAGVAVLCTSHIHGSRSAPIDRSVLFTSFLFLLIFLAARATTMTVPTSRVVIGFALYAGVSVAGQIERTLAAVHRDVTRYNVWSYVQPVAYLALVFCWIVFLPSSDRDGSGEKTAKEFPVQSGLKGPALRVE